MTKQTTIVVIGSLRVNILYSTVILSLPLIQEGQLAVSGERMCTISGERMCTILVNRFED